MIQICMIWSQTIFYTNGKNNSRRHDLFNFQKEKKK